MTGACYVGVDVGLTAAKAAAFAPDGAELHTVVAANPRVAVSADRQEIDMAALFDVVARVLSGLTAWLSGRGWAPAAVGVTGHGNGLYLVDEDLRPVRPAIASTDARAGGLVAAFDPDVARRIRRVTGSVPWAAQPALLLRWLHDHEPETLARGRWVLSCKDWITACLTGRVGTDYSDASASGLLSLSGRDYAAAVPRLVGLPDRLRPAFPPPVASDSVVGEVQGSVAVTTGLPAGTPVVAGCMDCVASPLGAGSTNRGDVTIIVGTWSINSVVVPAVEPPPAVTLNALLPDPTTMLAMEVAPTSAAALEWFASLMSAGTPERISPPDLLQAASEVPAGSGGLLFLPFLHGAPEHPGATGTLVGARAGHGYGETARAVAEGITHYHRVQVEKLRGSGAHMSEAPWTLAGGGARNPVWAQMFADVLGHPIRRQLGTELGARGVAGLAARGVGADVAGWTGEPDPALVVEPGKDQEAYREQAARFDRTLAALAEVWSAAAGPVGTDGGG